MAAHVSGRRQSTRQIRTSTTRPLNYYARTFDGRGAAGADAGASSSHAQPGFFPAITHFTDAVDALPQEMIRHFSMLKEVEAKVHQPDEELRRLSDGISRLPPPPKSYVPSHESHFPGLSAQNSIKASRNGSVNSAFTPLHPPVADGPATAGQATPNDAQNESERQQLFRQLNYTIIHMAPILDEKMAVLSTANQLLRQQLDRMESSYRYVSEEVSDEARFGNPKHWAYVTEKEPKKPPERSRRENAGTNHYNAAVDDLASARSEARREAVQAKRRRHQVDSDFDDAPAPRKGPKGRRPAAEAADGRSVGLGITNGVGGPGKKRKTAAAPGMERSISAAMRGQVNASHGSGQPTPAAEPKKRTKAAPGPAPKKRYAYVYGSQVLYVLTPVAEIKFWPVPRHGLYRLHSLARFLKKRTIHDLRHPEGVKTRPPTSLQPSLQIPQRSVPHPQLRINRSTAQRLYKSKSQRHLLRRKWPLSSRKRQRRRQRRP
jgi:gamma-glutamylcyclotransferase (GGCT)/AIG2-like uncharacterized protein YtfP